RKASGASRVGGARQQTDQGFQVQGLLERDRLRQQHREGGGGSRTSSRPLRDLGRSRRLLDQPQRGAGLPGTTSSSRSYSTSSESTWRASLLATRGSLTN